MRHLSEYAAKALAHLGLVARPVRVEEFGSGATATYRCAVDTEAGWVAVVFDTPDAAPRVSKGTPPPPDAIGIGEVDSLATAALTRWRASREAGESVDRRVVEIETSFVGMPPAAAALLAGWVSGQGRSGWEWGGDDSRIWSAFERGWDRVVGRVAGPILSAEDREANRVRSMEQQRRVAEERALLEVQFGDVYDGDYRTDLLGHMARVRLGLPGAREKLRRATGFAQKKGFGGRPILAEGASVAEMARIVAHKPGCPVTTAADAHHYLDGDWQADTTRLRRAITAAEEMLAAAASD